MTNPSLSVVAPCYNEQESLEEFYRRVSVVCQEIVGDSFEIVLVNDGSRDRSWALMAEMAERDRHIVAVDLSRNHGHQLALSAGLAVCRGERILILDADLQDPPELLGQMMASMDAGADVVYGQRVKRDGETAFKKATAKLFYRLLSWLSEADIPMDAGDFRLMSRRALDVLNSMPEHHRFVRGMVSWIGYRQEALLYERSARYAGATKYPVGKMLRFASDAITGFSVRPLRLASYLAAGFGAVALLLLIYVLVSWLSGSAVQGWTSLIAVLLALGSAQLLVMGIMGEYLGRLFIEAKRRPLYVIQDVVRASDGSKSDAEA